MRVRLPKDARAPLLARALVRRELCERHGREARDEVELLVSELVTNAVLHGGSLVTLEVDCEAPEGITVAVGDNSPALPSCSPAGPEDESGRGMALVALISDAWGVRASGRPPVPSPAGPAPVESVGPVSSALPHQAPGKVVWFHLAG